MLNISKDFLKMNSGDTFSLLQRDESLRLLKQLYLFYHLSTSQSAFVAIGYDPSHMLILTYDR